MFKIEGGCKLGAANDTSGFAVIICTDQMMIGEILKIANSGSAQFDYNAGCIDYVALFAE